jgi:5,10-methylene-tetrahydrofolate dehydrogenase/methenyl tetrahydrofolate cyclohydrolase
MNQDSKIDGIILQHPLPEHLDESYLTNLISYKKDVDGTHPLNAAALARFEDPFFTP